MRAATGSARKVAVLGEMLELGAHADAAARGVRRARRPPPGSICSITVGGAPARALADAAGRGGHAAERRVATSPRTRKRRTLALQRVRPGDLVLVKGSRGIGTDAGRRAAEGGVRLMLYHLLYPLHTSSPVLNVTRYITFRTAAASLTALVIGLFLGPCDDPQAARVPDRPGDPAGGPGHAPHEGRHADDGRAADSDVGARPDAALGGSDRIRSSGSRCSSTAAFGAIGFADDYLKIVRRSHHGLRPRYKMGWQIVVGARRRRRAARAGAARPSLYSTRLIFPFFKRLIPDLGWFYVPFAVARARRRDQRGQPDRRPRRAGDQRVRGRGGGVHGARLRVDASRVRRIPAARAARLGSRRADDLLRRARRREPRVPLVELLSRRDLHGRRRLARPRRRARHRRAAHQAGVPARDRRRRVRHRGAVGDHPGRLVQDSPASASSRWRRCTTTSS